MKSTTMKLAKTTAASKVAKRTTAMKEAMKSSAMKVAKKTSAMKRATKPTDMKRNTQRHLQATSRGLASQDGIGFELGDVTIQREWQVQWQVDVGEKFECPAWCDLPATLSNDFENSYIGDQHIVTVDTGRNGTWTYDPKRLTQMNTNTKTERALRRIFVVASRL